MQRKVYPKKMTVKAVAKDVGMSEESVSKVYDSLFKIMGKKIMEGYTVQVEEFGSFKLKHLGRRVQPHHALNPDHEVFSEEHLKIHFMAFADLRRRAERKLMRQKKKEEEEANADTE